MPKLKQDLLTGGALVNTAGAILGNWKNGIGATAGLPSSSKSMRSDDAAVAFSHGGASSASRDSELRFRWGDVLLLDDVLSIVSCTLSLVIGLRWHARGLQGGASARAIG